MRALLFAKNYSQYYFLLFFENNQKFWSSNNFTLIFCEIVQEIDPIILSVGEEDEVSIMDALKAVVKAFDFKVCWQFFNSPIFLF